MNTLTIFVIIALATVSALVWAALEDDRDERGGK